MSISGIAEMFDDNSNIIEERKSDPPMQHMVYRISKTIVIFFCWITYGMINEVYGPTLPGLKFITNTNNEEIGLALALRSVGVLLGLFVGGATTGLWKNQLDLSLAVSLVGSGITVAVIPICRSLISISTVILIHGACSAGIVMTCTPILLDLWHDKLTGPFNFVTSGVGIGAISIPLILDLFGKGPDYSKLNHANLSNMANSTHQVELSESIITLYYPYFTVGCFCGFVAIQAFIYFLIPNPMSQLDESVESFQRSRTITDSIIHVSRTCADKYDRVTRKVTQQIIQSCCDCKTVSIAFITFISLTFCMGTDVILNKYTFSYAVEGKLALHNSDGYLLQALYWISFSTGRVITMLLTIKISSRWFILVLITGLTTVSIVESFIQNNTLVFYVCTLLFAMFDAPIFPTIFGVLRLYGDISMNMMTIAYCGISVGSASFQYFGGLLIQKYGYFTFPYTVMFGAISTYISISFLVLIPNFFPPETYDRMDEDDDLPSTVFDVKCN